MPSDGKYTDAQREYNRQYNFKNKEKRAAAYQANKNKILAQQKEYYETKKKDLLLMKNFKMTPEDYNKMFEDQFGCCKICGIHQVNLKSTLCVDHCHTTGKIRGLLCHQCNLFIGNAKDDINILENAIKYLNENT
jgi:hypothetical protein